MEFTGHRSIDRKEGCTPDSALVCTRRLALDLRIRSGSPGYPTIGEMN